MSGRKWLVSTVLVIHKWGASPISFYETMVFQSLPNNEIDYTDQYVERYANDHEAISGHEKACALVAGWNDAVHKE
jgi:hypothetical protein